MSPWLDLRVPPKEVKLPEVEKQEHRRFIKTHLPVDALVFSPKAKYIYIGRDGRDVAWSMFNHHSNANDFWYHALNDTPGRVGPPIEKPTQDIVQYYRDWLDKDGFPFWPFMENIKSWWEIRNLPNVHLIHFSNMKEDMPGEIKKVAAFLGIEIDPSKWEAILEHCSFDYMKKHSTKSVPLGGAFWDGGSDTFINKGINGRWREVLTEDDQQLYRAVAARELSPSCIEWLEGGRLGLRARFLDERGEFDQGHVGQEQRG